MYIHYREVIFQYSGFRVTVFSKFLVERKINRLQLGRAAVETEKIYIGNTKAVKIIQMCMQNLCRCADFLAADETESLIFRNEIAANMNRDRNFFFHD